jgi:hypothetical protein
MATPLLRWRGKTSAALLGGLLVMTMVAGGVASAWPPPALERIYAGVFLGVMAWLLTLLCALLAGNGRCAWKRVLWILAAAAALMLFRGGH